MSEVTRDVIEEAVIDVIAEYHVQRRQRRLDAKHLRDFLELDVLAPLLEDAMKTGPEAMGEWWALRLTLQPTIASLRLIEAGQVKAANDYWEAAAEFEEKVGVPAGIAQVLLADWK